MTAALVAVVGVASVTAIACLPWRAAEWDRYVQAAAWYVDWITILLRRHL